MCPVRNATHVLGCTNAMAHVTLELRPLGAVSTRVILLVLFAELLTGCKHRESSSSGGSASLSSPNAAPSASPAAHVDAGPPAPTIAPDARARSFLQRQIDAALAHTNELAATFTSDAVILLEGGASSPASSASSLGIGDGGPDGVQTTKATIGQLIARGTPDAVWFYAEVNTESQGPNGQPSLETPTRVIELIAASEQWRAVAASFGVSAKLQPSGGNSEIPNATGPAGPLATLLSTPSSLSSQLAGDAIVVGPIYDQLSNGNGAGSALASWKLEPLTLYKHAREVHQTGWGFAQGTFDHPESARPQLIDRLTGQTFAIPSSDGSWKVVLVEYLAN
jgi:hypothetical protein